jgi:hypothetical protein
LHSVQNRKSCVGTLIKNIGPASRQIVVDFLQLLQQGNRPSKFRYRSYILACLTESHICDDVKKTGINFHLFLLSDFQAAADEITNKGAQCVNQHDSSSQKNYEY